MKGREELLKKLLSTIPDNYEKIIIDDEDLLLAAKRNKGAKKAKGEYFFFVDDDNYLAPGAIEAALRIASKEGIGVVGFMACYDNAKDKIADGGSLRNHLTGFTEGVNTNFYWHDIPGDTYEVDEVANAFMVHSETFHELHGFDEKNFPIDLDEADFCKRVKEMCMMVVMNPKALCYHKSQTYSHVPDFRRPMNAYYMGRNKILYQRKHLKPFQYWIYLIFFFWMTPTFYSFSLLYRGKPQMVFHFLRGIKDGLFSRTNP